LLKGNFGKEIIWCCETRNTMTLSFFFLFTFEFWFFISLVYVSYWYIRSIIFIKQLYGKNSNKVLIRQLCLYPLGLFLNWIFIPLEKIFFMAESKTLLFLYVLFVSSEGILNSVVYGLRRKMRNSLRSAIGTHLLVEKEMEDVKIEALK
jgi:hypothetical protein